MEKKTGLVSKWKGEQHDDVYLCGFDCFEFGANSGFGTAVPAGAPAVRGQGWCYRDLQRVLLRIGAVESSLTDAREEQEKLRDRLEESFDVVAAKLDMLTPEEEEMAAFSQGLENILGYTPEAGWEEA